MDAPHTVARHIHVIYTGGTIGMVPNPHTGSLVPGRLDLLLEHAPALGLIPGVELSFATLEPPVDSSDMGPTQWRRLASLIAKAYDQHDGFVVLHGTDTLSYTASALSFMLQGLAKPVVLTGSQLPIAQAGSDAPRNLRDAVAACAATDADSTQAILQEVAVCFGGAVMRGNRSTKTSSTAFQAFSSPNLAPLGRVAEDGTVEFDRTATLRAGSTPDTSEGTQPPNASPKAFLELEPAVAMVWVHPGLEARQLRSQLEAPGIKGAVLASYGAGNMPTDKPFTRVLRDAADRGLLLAAISQCSHGGVAMGRYEASKALSEAGVAAGADMTLEAALTKAMHLLGQGFDARESASLMRVPLAGELTVR